MQKIYIIEHLEKEVFPWCLIEYKNISKIVGKENLWFCNLNGIKGTENLFSLGKCIKESVRKLALKNACVLDPDAKKTLSPEESKKLQYFIFGGILGDYPPRKRTKKELSSFLPDVSKYNIGKGQMSTDNAVYVVKQIIKGKKLNEIPFQDKAEIKINGVESTILPYKYALIKGKPLVSLELIKYLRRTN